MKMQKYVIFENKNIENKYLKDKKYCRIWDHCCYTGKYRGTVHGLCSLKYRVPKKIL